jgi:RES domain-containing protein
MIVFRISKKEYSDDLSGIGAEMAGGRWNFKGTRILYTSDSRALCTAEIAVHTPIGIIPKDFFLITIEFPKDIPIREVKLNELPKNWNDCPYTATTQEIGEEFIAKREFLILKVPSAVVPGGKNV